MARVLIQFPEIIHLRNCSPVPSMRRFTMVTQRRCGWSASGSFIGTGIINHRPNVPACPELSLTQIVDSRWHRTRLGGPNRRTKNAGVASEGRGDLRRLRRPVVDLISETELLWSSKSK